MSQADGIGWIEVICGSMFSGKTEELLRRVKRAKIAKQKIKIFKPKKDVRYDKKKVISHDQNSIKSKPIFLCLLATKIKTILSVGSSLPNLWIIL